MDRGDSTVIDFDKWFDKIGTQHDDKEQAAKAAWVYREEQLQNELDMLKAEKAFLLSKCGVDESGIFHGRQAKDVEMSQKWLTYHIETQGFSEYDKREYRRGLFHWLYDTRRITLGVYRNA